MKTYNCIVTNILKYRNNKIKIVCKDIVTGKKITAVSSLYNKENILRIISIGSNVEVYYDTWHGTKEKIKSVEININGFTCFWNLVGKRSTMILK